MQTFRVLLCPRVGLSLFEQMVCLVLNVVIIDVIYIYDALVGHGIPPLLKGIMQLFPLDTYVAAPVRVTLPLSVFTCVSMVI